MTLETDYYNRPEVSHSDIVLYQKDPLVYHHSKAQGPDLPSKAQQFGTLVHCWLLEPETVEEKYAVVNQDLTTPMMRKFIESLVFNGYADSYDYGSKEREVWDRAWQDAGYKNDPEKLFLSESAQEYCKQHENVNGRQIVSLQDWRKAIDMSQAMSEKGWFDLFHQNEYAVESEIYWKEPFTKTECRSKLDLVLSHDNGTYSIIDYKTTREDSLGAFLESAKSYKYDQQLAFYNDALSVNNNVRFEDIKCYIVAQSTVKPYPSWTIQISPKTLFDKSKECAQTLKKMKNEKYNDKKPDGILVPTARL